MKTAKRLFKLFAGLDRARGSYVIDPDINVSSKVSGKAKTVAEAITEKHWARHLDGIEGLGVVPIRDDQCCMFAAIDIDEIGISLEGLAKDVIAAFLSGFIVCRSKSGGAHVYCFLEEPIPCSKVKPKMDQIAAHLGYPGVEIFPKQVRIEPDGIGNWLNMPYFNLAGPTSRYAVDARGQSMTVEEFIVLAEESKYSRKDFLSINLPEKVEQPFADGPVCLQRIHRRALEKRPGGDIVGIEGGQRNNVFFNVGVYLRARGEGEWKDSLDEFNQSFNKPMMKSGDVQATIASLKKEKPYSYQCNVSPLRDFCDRATCSQRDFGIGGGAKADEFEWERIVGDMRIERSQTIRGDWIIDDDPLIWLRVKDRDVFLSQSKLRGPMYLQELIEREHQIFLRGPSKQKWETLRKGWIESSQYQDVPFEDTSAGNWLYRISEYCRQYGTADTVEEVHQGMVWYDVESNSYWAHREQMWEKFQRDGVVTKRDGKSITSQRNELYAMFEQVIGIKKASRSCGKTARIWIIPKELTTAPQEPIVKLVQTDF